MGAAPQQPQPWTLGDMLIAPGFVDVHVHGGGGAQVNCATREEVEASVAQHGAFSRHARHNRSACDNRVRQPRGTAGSGGRCRRGCIGTAQGRGRRARLPP